MRRYFLFIFLISFFSAKAQTLEHDWENYVIALNGKPVSINVDLGLFKSAPMKERPFAIIFRTTLQEPDTRGMPYPEEYEVLLKLEESLVNELAKENGAIFAGRFTQRGLREFYFYAPDTIGYIKAMYKAMEKFPTYQWLVQAKEDKKWENYFTVLYPSEPELMRLRSRIQVERILQVGGGQKKSVMIEHSLAFSKESDRAAFLKSLTFPGLKIVSMPENPDFQSGKYLLQLRQKAVPDMIWVESFIMKFYAEIKKAGGSYIGWSDVGA
jgi:uncharacterized protein (TIGR01619 family)